jgi:hypothetical protein
MNKEQQRIAIAVACGWTYPRIVNEDPMGRPPETTDRFEVVPDYLNDLNAMHEAEKTLPNHQHQVFYRHLERIVSGEPYDEEGHYGAGWLFHNVHATATQRAEAFLRTIGKWVE